MTVLVCETSEKNDKLGNACSLNQGAFIQLGTLAEIYLPFCGKQSGISHKRNSCGEKGKSIIIKTATRNLLPMTHQQQPQQ